MNFAFVYSKDGIVKVLDFEKAQKKEKKLLEEGWIHTATLNPCVFIEYLCNNSVSIEQDVKGLLKN